MKSINQYDGKWGENAQLALDTLAMKPTKGIASWILNVMDWGMLEEVAGFKPGDYEREPEKVYRQFQLTIGASFCDQWIPRNPLSMGSRGYESNKERTASAGLEEVVLDGMKIDSPEAVVEHMEKFVWPGIKRELNGDEGPKEKWVQSRIEHENDIQRLFGPNLLKSPYDGFQRFPYLRYGSYGYVNYFMAYALYPEVIARDFKLQADLAVRKNGYAAEAIVKGGLPRVVRLDHDMADSRSTLVDIKSLDKIWFPEFVRSIKPLLDAGVRLIWHCDGNLMQMVPRLLECGLGGFQGFQYEDEMDYEKICKMKDRNGNPLMIWGGVSVTRTLPHGTTDDVKKELTWLVKNGPKVGFVLGGSSSIAPSTNRDNIRTLIEGMKYYREHGR
jgi:hypothetical protein